MFGQQTYRPEIARVAEETVLNLKQLECRIEVLRNDLAALCTVLGHPEAARIAVTPPAWLGITPYGTQGNVGNLGNMGSFGQTPFQGGMAYGQGINPSAQQGSTPYGVGTPSYGQSVNPLSQGVSPWAQQGTTPYGVGTPSFGQSFNPLSQGVSPWAQQQGGQQGYPQGYPQGGQQGYPQGSPYASFSPYQGYNTPSYGAVPPFGSPGTFQPPYPPIR